MRKPFECPHPDDRMQLRKRVAGGAGVMLGHQCLNCGRVVGQWKKHEQVPCWQDLPQWDHQIHDLWYEAEKKYMLEYREWRVTRDGVAAFAKDPDEQQLFFQSYNEYLNSPAWREKRTRVLKRAHGICEGCGVNHATQAHHTSYARVGHEMLFDLVAICDACHDIVHGKVR